jgi:hypothetical protein
MKSNLKKVMPLILLATFVVVFITSSCEMTSQEVEVMGIEETNMAETTMAETTMVETMLYSAELTGDMEVPAVKTTAKGMSMFMLSDDMQSMSYSISVENLADPFAAHIHWATEGQNGPAVVTLFPRGQFIAAEGAVMGLLAEGTFTAEDLSGPLEGMSIDDLLEGIIVGTAYVNIHTNAYPDGEIRGQIEVNIQ